MPPPVSYDLRESVAERQILTICRDQLSLCRQLSDSDTVEQDMLTYLETVFRSLSCLNGSFLMPNNDHFYCTSRHHGVDVALAESAFDLIGQMENQSVKSLIWNGVEELLKTALTDSPPDVEALRVYLTIPNYHEFNNPKQFSRIHRPFAEALLALKPQPRRVVSSWWSATSNDFFEKLVNIFKRVTIFIIANNHSLERETVVLHENTVVMLEVLAFLNKLNHSVDGLKIPYDIFHIPELTDHIDVNRDYFNWLQGSGMNTKYFLCNYPFIFDAQVKTQLLRTDQALQMHVAMNSGASILSLFMPQLQSQFLLINVSRENLVADAIQELSMVDAADLKKPLKVKFLNEEAEDGGGVQKEFFLLLLREILDPKYGMFHEYEETRAIWFSESTFEGESMYFLIGTICGLAIYNYRIINIPFPLALYKKLLKEPVVLADLKGLSPMMANSLQSLLDYADDDFVDVFGLNFDISRDIFGETVTMLLKPDGENIPVTQENKKEYVELYVDYILNKSVEKPYQAFCAGFMKVCGGRVLELFHAHELQAVVVGNENYDWHALQEVAEYKNGYRSSDQVIQWFWEVLHEFSLEDKKKFLLFLTGSDRIPIQGMKAIKIIIQPTNDEKFLPVAHTCFNLLDLPRYQTKERLKYKLLQAIQQTLGFSLV